MACETCRTATEPVAPATFVRVVLLMALLVTPSLKAQDASELRAAVVKACLEYRDAWLANDEARVMATLTPDATLFPSTLEPVSGGTRSDVSGFHSAS